MSYADELRAELRLDVLRLLDEAAGYTINDRVLHRAMTEVRRYAISADQLRAEMTWLAEQGLVRIDPVEGLMVAALTERGQDVAMGRARVPGVARPRPGM